MIFQILDDKKHCAGFYADGKIVYDEKPNNPSFTGTWSFSPHIEGDVEYAQVYTQGKSLSEVCPEEYRQEWDTVSKKMKAFLRSFDLAGVSLDEHCFYDLVPERYLLEYCEIKNLICEHVFKTYEKPKNYDFLVSVGKVVSKIERQSLNLNLQSLSPSLTKPRVREFWKKMREGEQYIKYNLFGTKTGRLSTHRSSFPIHNISKELRCVIEPKNDFLVELDFNAAEVRTLLALSGKEQPKGDIHDWHINNVFDGDETRDEAKRKVFAWMYNPERKEPALDRMYNRDAVVQKYFNGSQVSTFLSRTIPADSKHALNYIIQSTTSDLLLQRMVEIDRRLESMDSFVSFCIHDNLVLDMKAEECYIIPEIIKIFSSTGLGEFKVNMRVGRNYGDMRETSKWTQ